MEVTKWLKHSGAEGRKRRPDERAGRNMSERRAGPETGSLRKPPQRKDGEGRSWKGQEAGLRAKQERNDQESIQFRRGNGDGMCERGDQAQHGRPFLMQCNRQTGTP